MARWWAVFRKDFLLGRTRWLVWLSILGAGGLAVMVGLSTRRAPYFVAPALGGIVMAATVHPILMPVSVFSLLRKEWRNTPALWLKTPDPGLGLLASKLAVSWLYTVGSWALLTVIAAGAAALLLARPGAIASVPHLHLLLQRGLPVWRLAIRYGVYGLVVITGIGVYVSAWVALLVLFAHTVKHTLGRARGVAVVLVALIPTWGLSWLTALPGLRGAVYSGMVRVPLEIPSVGAPIPQFARVAVGGPLVFYGGVTVVVLAMAALLLDRKVEV